MYAEIRARSMSPDTYKGTPAGGPSSAGGGPCWHHVDPRDAARAFRLALEMKYTGFDRFFVSANVTLAPEPTLERLARVLGRLPEIRRPEIYEQNPFAPLYDLTRSREVLGFDAQYDARAVSLLKEAV
jgi:nucleoside-diphosphate-sugar epimerase